MQSISCCQSMQRAIWLVFVRGQITSSSDTIGRHRFIILIPQIISSFWFKQDLHYFQKVLICTHMQTDLHYFLTLPRNVLVRAPRPWLPTTSNWMFNFSTALHMATFGSPTSAIPSAVIPWLLQVVLAFFIKSMAAFFSLSLTYFISSVPQEDAYK